MAQHSQSERRRSETETLSPQVNDTRKTRYDWARMEREAFFRALPSAQRDYQA